MYNKNELIIFKYPYRISQNINILKYINLNIFEYWYKDNYFTAFFIIIIRF